MSKEFPFINDEAEALREGNKNHDAKYYAESLKNGFLLLFNIEQVLALNGSFISVASDSDQEESWDLSSIYLFESNAITEVQ